MSAEIGPGFTAATRFPLRHIGGPSVELANRIRTGHIRPDVFLSADAEVNRLLMGEEHGEVAPWYFLMYRQRMMIPYSPVSRFRADFEAVAAGAKPWHETCQNSKYL